MLIRITNHCTMGCTHCLVEATPAGEHMASETFEAVVRFVLAEGFPFLMVSGGEPTDHPSIVEFIKHAVSEGLYTLVLSNGEFLHGNEKRHEAILEAATGVQVTNDPRFYPRRVEPYEHPKVAWETHIRMVSPQGRAKDTGLADKTIPECFNLRSLVRSGMTFQAARLTLAGRGRFCTPSINVDGSISAGEAPSCKKIGYVTDDDATITHNLREMRCQRCGLTAKLDSRHKQAIGESSD